MIVTADLCPVSIIKYVIVGCVSVIVAAGRSDAGDSVYPQLDDSAIVIFGGASSMKPIYRMGSLGDSITTAFDADGWFDNPALSWSSGYDPASIVKTHYKRLQALFPEFNVQSVNVAQAGSVASDVVKQSVRLQTYRVDYATLLVGANDVCKWQDPIDDALTKFEKDVATSIQNVIDANGSVKILVGAIPAVDHLKRLNSSSYCQFVWDYAGFCNPLLTSDRTPDDIKAFGVRLARANAALANVTSKFPEHVRFVAATSDPIFLNEHVSNLDCFHPNILEAIS